MPQSKELSPCHREVVRRQAMGQRSSEIGAALDMSASNVRMIWRKPEAKEYLQYLLAMIDFVSGLTLKRLQLDAVQALKDALNDSSRPGLQLKAAVQILDRTGVGTPER